jgi:excinuclease ABC subunit C
MNKNKHISSILEKTPHLPGVYKFIDEDEKVIYVGKAKDLKNRVSNYFNKSGDDRLQLPSLLQRVVDIEYIVVDSELEALFLETNLIKKLKPKYNILMKDDKNFVYIKITTQNKFPKLFITRRILKDKATYIGPYTSGRDIKKTFKLIKDLLPFPHCELSIQSTKQGKHPQKPICIFKEIDEAHTPCICDLNQEEYNQVIKSIINFLKGKHDDLLNKIKQNMLLSAQNQKFERAAKLRDRLILLEKILEKQQITSANLKEDIDIIDIIHSNKKFLCNVFQVRSGKVINNQNLILSENQIKDDENPNLSLALSSFIQQYYNQHPNPPKEILIPEPAHKQNLLEEYLTKIYQHKITINIPQKGRKKDLLRLATKNVENFAKQMKVKWMSDEARSYVKIAEELKELLNLKKLPKRLECYDISHLQGTHTVASMVVFENGEPLKSNYRIFNIKSLQKGEIDDFQSMQEVIHRRLKYLSQIPKGFKVSNKKNQYILKNQDKEEVINITYEITEKKEISIQEITVNQLDHLVIPLLIKLCKKFKQRKALTNLNLKQYQFQPIKNNDHQYGFYISKLKPDPSFSQKPDLIIIDGGKGQLSSALKSKKQLQSKIPFISLAKKHEKIFTEAKKSIQLPNNSPTRLLIQQLRDEAHRFAITHNRKRRQKIRPNS